MQVLDFSIDVPSAVQGDKVKLAVTVKVEAGDEVNGMLIWAEFEGIGGVLWYRNDNFNVDAGRTASFSPQITIPHSLYVNEALQTRRALRPTSFGIQFGFYGTRTDVAYDFALLDSHHNPMIGAFELERCAEGVPDDEGEQLRLRLRISTLGQPKTGVLGLKMYYRRGGAAAQDSDYLDLSSYIEQWLGTDSVAEMMLEGPFDKAVDWGTRLWFGDEFESAAEELTVGRSFANMHLSGMESGGVCFGGFCKSVQDAPMLESYFPVHAYAGIAGVSNYISGEEETGGAWIDGKRIHRFIASGTTELAGAQAVIATLPSVPETLIALRAMLRTEGGSWRPVPYAYYGDMDWSSALYQEGADICLSVGKNHSGEKAYIIIAEYTKI